MQEAEVEMPVAILERLWTPEYLERLARSYWRFLSRITLSLIRVVYGPDSRTVVLISPRLPLLRFHAPRYETGVEHASVTWPIERGLLVAREGRDRGHLRIEVERLGEAGLPSSARLHVKVEVRNFYPWIRGRGRFARVGTWIYANTQLRIHVLVCRLFLRSLARLDLPPSKVARCARRSTARAIPGRRVTSLVAGASGFIGSALVAALASDGGEVRSLVRNPPKAGPLRDAGSEIVVADLAHEDRPRGGHGRC